MAKVKLNLKPEIAKQILSNNKLRFALQDLWEVRERAMENAIKFNKKHVFLPDSLALIESYTKVPKEQLYQEVTEQKQ